MLDRTTLRRLGLIALCSLLLHEGARGVLAGVGRSSEDSERVVLLKAAFLVQFPAFVTWPDETFPEHRTTLKIGVLGKDPFGKVLDKAVKKQKVVKRPIEVKRSRSLSDLADCHMLFVARSERINLDEILKELRERPVFVVSDLDEFAHRGGCLGLRVLKNRVKLDVNKGALDASRLKVSSRLLRLADKVIR